VSRVARPVVRAAPIEWRSRSSRAGTVVDAARNGALAAAGSVVVVGCWVVATAWIPLLVGAEWHRCGHRRLRYEHTRWCTVFPLGMYVVACRTVAATTPLTGLREWRQRCIGRPWRRGARRPRERSRTP
jgi:hypothetical protein